jgi:alpha-amylase/alpha-mannosidase (GH57 family)
MTFATESLTYQSATTTHYYTENKTGIYVTIHGHFYQPPRENPYLNTIERQPSATPFHDWNERIFFECYRPNAFARIVNAQNQIVNIVNNFEYMSFNIGATLMSWLEKYDLEVYQRILEGDRQSVKRLNGHGNAIAQVYNHIILPLANERDKYTQIRWGKEDFRQRFQRDPEGMWLAETAVDYATLEVLIEEGIKFIILAPSQAQRCRPFASNENPDPQWHEVGGSQIDPTRPYRCFVDKNSEKYIDIFFYDGPISRDMGFNDVLQNASMFASRLSQAVRGDHRPSQLLSVATDGETFGHHKYATEKCIAYAVTQEFPQKGWTVTNYAHYLSLHPPVWEVILKPVTAWSCAHGVDRWQDDCGCGGGGEWHQKWRKPLRNALDWLRDQLIEIYDDLAPQFFLDPWSARDDYISVILDRSAEKIEHFFTRHQSHALTSTERIDALRLLEMQRHALLMYTSCGWFFEEISRPEGVQILRYASRALELAGELTGIQLEAEFLKYLALAPSNLKKYQDGAMIYEKLVLSAQIGFKQVAAHYAISSLFTNYPEAQKIYCYDAQQLDYQKRQIGSLTLAVGQVRLTSEITQESSHFIFAVLHLGGWDFHCCIQPFVGRGDYGKLKETLFNTLNQASVVEMILVMSQSFGNEFFNLENLFAEERHRIMQKLADETKRHLDQLYTQIYRDNYSIMVAFQRDELPVPQELQVAAEVALSHRCRKSLASLEQYEDDPETLKTHLNNLLAIAVEVNHLRCKLSLPEGKKALENLILRKLWNILHGNNDHHDHTVETNIQQILQMMEIGEKLHLNLELDQAQELYFNCLHHQIIPNCLQDQHPNGACPWQSSHLRIILQLGQKLGVAVD